LRIDVAEALRREGHDVVRASEVGQERADDSEILERAKSEERILITFDEHFGNWVVLPIKKHFGVIRLKISPTTSANTINLLVPFLKNRTQDQFKRTCERAVLIKTANMWDLKTITKNNDTNIPMDVPKNPLAVSQHRERFMR